MNTEDKHNLIRWATPLINRDDALIFVPPTMLTDGPTQNTIGTESDSTEIEITKEQRLNAPSQRYK